MKGYRLTLKKSEIEKYNFQDYELDIEYTNNHIIITKQKELPKKE